jgi:hypothetical protein
MALDDVYVLTGTAQGPAGFFQNSAAFSMIVAPDPTPAQALVLANDLKAIWLSRQNNSIVWRTWKLRQVRGDNVSWPTGTSCNPIGGRLVEGNYGTGSTGEEIGDALPPQCAMVVTFKTGQIGRRYRGRMYGFGFGEADQLAGIWTSAALTEMEANLATFMGKYAPGSAGNLFQFGIWSYRIASGCVPNKTTGKHERVDPPHPELAYTPVTTHVLRNIVYTQRRRVLGVGR